MREWKPGDVAMVRTSEHGELVGLRTDSPERGGEHEFFNTAGFSYATDAQLRPLVVIDPEDREQVGRLVELVAKGGGIDPMALMTTGQRILQAALRSLVTPPKPDEPTGLGAVVEDGFGVLWIRHGSGPAPWMLAGAPPSNRDTYPWSGIVAVKILSDGVQP